MAFVDRPQWIQFIILFFSFLIFYATFRSPDLMAVDGPFRSCEVYYRQEIFFHANNHLLYPVNVRTWGRLMRVVLGECRGPLEFALMNAVDERIRRRGFGRYHVFASARRNRFKWNCDLGRLCLRLLPGLASSRRTPQNHQLAYC